VSLEEFGVDVADATDQGDEIEPTQPATDTAAEDGPTCTDCESDSSLVTERDPYDVPLCATCYLDREGL
jgi:hypothetical protein